MGAITLAACSPSRAIESVRLLQELASEEETAPVPRRMAECYQVRGKEYEADLYLPPAGARASIVLVPGVTPQGKDDPRLVAFARDLARARLLVLVPEISNLRELKVSAEDAEVIAGAVGYLAGRQRPLGIAAISYAAGPAMLAALGDEAGRDVEFMILIGGYYDIGAVVRFFSTGFYREGLGQPWQHREPNAYGKWVFARSNADRLTEPRDRHLLRTIADRKLGDLNAAVEDLVSDLGPEGRSVLDLLTNRDPERVGTLIAGLPPSIRLGMEALDVSRRDLSRISANVILVHGRDDAIIPVSESRALAAALHEGRADLFVVNGLAHADLRDVTPGDALTLWRAVYRVLQMRDSPAWPAPD